jgi:hypothetical protein
MRRSYDSVLLKVVLPKSFAETLFATENHCALELSKLVLPNP